MAFKSVKSYNEEKYGGLFILRDDGDYADVIFLYESADDVLVADTHYIKSSDYNGYVHCCGKGCPACAKDIRVQTKLFIPLYNIMSGEIEFWDRTMKFEPVLQRSVFSKFPNPSEFVFRITRHGAAGDYNTTYEITAIGRNSVRPYGMILAEKNATMPEYYSNVCKDASPAELSSMLNDESRPTTEYTPTGGNYTPAPRTSVGSPSSIPAPTVDVSAYEPPSDVPFDTDESDGLENPVF